MSRTDEGRQGRQGVTGGEDYHEAMSRSGVRRGTIGVHGVASRRLIRCIRSEIRGTEDRKFGRKGTRDEPAPGVSVRDLMSRVKVMGNVKTKGLTSVGAVLLGELTNRMGN